MPIVSCSQSGLSHMYSNLNMRLSKMKSQGSKGILDWISELCPEQPSWFAIRKELKKKVSKELKAEFEAFDKDLQNNWILYSLIRKQAILLKLQSTHGHVDLMPSLDYKIGSSYGSGLYYSPGHPKVPFAAAKCKSPLEVLKQTLSKAGNHKLKNIKYPEEIKHRELCNAVMLGSYKGGELPQLESICDIYKLKTLRLIIQNMPIGFDQTYLKYKQDIARKCIPAIKAGAMGYTVDYKVILGAYEAIFCMSGDDQSYMDNNVYFEGGAMQGFKSVIASDV